MTPRLAGARLQVFLVGLPGAHGPAAVVTHGGITTELLPPTGDRRPSC